MSTHFPAHVIPRQSGYATSAQYPPCDAMVAIHLWRNLKRARRSGEPSIILPSRRSEALVTEFLRDALAGDALGVTELEARARAAGLLGEGQRITHAKVFNKAKMFLEPSLNQTEWAKRDERAVRPPLCLGRVTIQVPRQKPLGAKSGADEGGQGVLRRVIF
jgi:hypothetical protein